MLCIGIIHMGLYLEEVLIYALQVVENQTTIIIATKILIIQEIIIFLVIVVKLTFKFQTMKLFLNNIIEKYVIK